MESLRAFFRCNRQVAALVIALALAMKALVPAGYMIGTEARTLTIEICGGQTPGKQDIHLAGKADGSANAHAKAGNECPYTALSMASMSGADAGLLAAALLFVLALGFAPVAAVTLPRRAFMTPPLRGPPAFS